MSIPTNKDIQKIAQLDLFQGATESDISSAIKGSLIKSLKHRQILYSAGDRAERFCVVVEGALKLIKPTPRGDDVIVHFATPGDVVGGLVMNQNNPNALYPITAKSMGPSVVLCIPRTTYSESWATNSKLQLRMQSLLYQRMSRIQEEKTLYRSPLQQRIAALLIGLSDKETDNDSNILSIPLTRQEIADSLGVAVESVIRVMSEWNQAGIIRTNEKYLEIVNIEHLLRLQDE